MGKKTSAATSPTTTSPTSPAMASVLPRMEPPPPYDQVAPGRRSSDISLHSTDHLQHSSRASAERAPAAASAASGGRPRRTASHELRLKRQQNEGGCLNVGGNVDVRVTGPAQPGYRFITKSGMGHGTFVPKSITCSHSLTPDDAGLHECWRRLR
jgi:hypothetical protein